MPKITQIKKRNGTLVPFAADKIVIAMQKAFREANTEITESKLRDITDSVVLFMEESFTGEKIPSVEDVQDLVEKAIMKDGYFEVAKAYILYRYEHAKIRAKEKEEVLQKIEENALFVIKRSGKKERFSLEKLKKSLIHAVKELPEEMREPVDVEAVAKQCQNEIYDGMKTEELVRAVIMVVRSMIEVDPAYSKFAARLLLGIAYKEVIGRDAIEYSKLEDQHRKAFIANLKRGVELERLDKRLLDFDLERLSKYISLERDGLFAYLGLQTLYDRYFVRDHEEKKVLETPQMFWMRVAMGTALNEKKEDQSKWTEEFYDIMSKFLYTPSTPTLFHAGTTKPQLSSCYLNTVPDSLDGIFKNYADNAQLSKWSGGLGTDWTNIRGTGSFIKGTGVESQGVIPFLKIANDVTVAINRSGRRRGAACVYLETWHYDILDFLELRKNTGDERRRTHDMDTANWIPDLFMKRVRDGGEWTLFSPEETPELHHIYGQAFEDKYAEYEKKADAGEITLFKRMPASDLWKKMLAMLFETGHPWITWKDPSNVRSPQDHIGVVHNSNLCTEITLNTSEDETAVCNLGSLNYAKFVVSGVFDKALVAVATKTAMRMLDNVIDINYYPTEDAERSNMRHRPVGLGVRGLHDALYLLGIDFDSQAAVEFSDESMETVAYYAVLTSSELAKERGAYKTFKGSKWDRGILPQDTIDLLAKERGEEIPLPRGGKLDWTPVREHIKKHGMRNSNCMAIAPTATTANIVGCIPTTEPIYKNVYVKSNQAGDFVVLNDYLVNELKTLGLWNKGMLNKMKYYDGSIQQISEIPARIKAKYKEVFEIDPKWLIDAAARRAKWIDQSQSLNIFFSGTSGRELSEVYFYAWKMGLKTTYYLRTLAASQVEKSTVATAEFGSTHIRSTFVMKEAEKIEESIAPEEIPPVIESKAVSEEYLAKVRAGEAVGICESCEG
ncbi:MAG: ribonucleoside-diphosphate reductase subunit alpha [Parcubacteria group bacterium]|nr:ribonucleoside-diphosphate reductase subunit alpha [Parcubacteria group bacterium]